MSGKIQKKYIVLIGAAAFLLMVGLAVIAVTQMASKDIEVTINGAAEKYETTSRTVGEFLEEKQIKLDKLDVVSPKKTKWIADGDTIKITKAVPFTVSADGQLKSLKALPKSIAETLESFKIAVGTEDRVTPALSEQLTAGTEIVVNRIIKKKKSVLKTVDYKIETKSDTALPAGTTKVVSEGKKGQVKITYACIYSDGKLIKKKELSRKIVKKPVARIVAKGTKETISGKEYKKKFTVKAYAYSGGGHTALGTAAREGAIAVDPNVIPLGTKVYVEGYGFATAEDTGGDIKGNTIDVYKNSESACNRWGVRYVTIYIL